MGSDEIKQSWRWLRGGVSSSQLVDLQAHTQTVNSERNKTDINYLNVKPKKKTQFKKITKYIVWVIITYNYFVNNLTALKCVFLQVKE